MKSHNIDLEALNARTGMTFRASYKNGGNPWVMAEHGRVYLFLREDALMVTFGEPADVMVVIHEGDLETSIGWLLDMDRTMARVRELLAAMTAVVGQ